MSRKVFLPLLLALLGLAQGCAYLNNRANDAKDMIDVGFTFSEKPQFALYASGPFVQVGTAGYGQVDGHFFGLGGGKFCLWAPHYEHSYGLLVWGREWISFSHSEAEIAAMTEEKAAAATSDMQVGIVGMPLGLAGVGAPPPGLKYIGSCPHYIHLGWIGVVGGPRYLQMLDFILGWTTLDICCDDDQPRE